jgi:hypothetical protein
VAQQLKSLASSGDLTVQRQVPQLQGMHVTIKKKILLWLALVYALAGVAAGLMKPTARGQGLLDYVLGIALLVGVYVWCRRDLPGRRPRRSGRWPLWSALCTPVVLPVYLFRTRPPARALKLVAMCLGLYLGLTLVFSVVAAVVSLARA